MNNFKNKSCKLCLTPIYDGNFQEIKDTIKDIIDIVLPKLNLDEETRHLICLICFGKLKAALDFKSICLDTDDCIYIHVDNAALPVDLKEVYVREKGNKELSKMPIDQEICRLCMRLVCDEFTAFSKVESSMISGYIPELNFDITEDPVICKSCLDSLNVHSSFLKDCLQIDEKFENMFDHKAVDSALDAQFSDWRIKTEEISIKCEDDQDETENLSETSNFEIGGHEDERNGIVSKNSPPYEMEQTEGDLKKCVLTDKSPKERPWYECNFCDHKTKRRDNLRMHILRLHKSPSEIEWHKCNLCTFKTKVQCALKGHMIVHKSASEIQWHKCNSCDYKSKYKRCLNSHNNLYHKSPSETQWYQCKSCDFKSKNRTNVAQHMFTHKSPSEIKWHECNLCNYKSKYKRGLNNHILKHKPSSEIVWYKCSLCDHRTHRKQNLKIHMVTHKSPSEIKWYECNSCSFKSKHKRSLDVHLLRHKSPSEIQWHECNLCGYKGNHKNLLNMHMVVHKPPSEVTWYHCDSCDYKAKSKRQLMPHMELHRNRTGMIRSNTTPVTIKQSRVT